MKAEVGNVVSEGVDTAQGIVDCQREIDNRSADRAGGQRRRQNARAPQVSDRRIVDDSRNVIKDERAPKTVVIGRYRGTEDEQPAYDAGR